MMRTVRATAGILLGMVSVLVAAPVEGGLLLSDETAPPAKASDKATRSMTPKVAPPPEAAPPVETAVPEAIPPRQSYVPFEPSAGAIVPDTAPPASSGAVVPEGFSQSDRYSNKTLNAINRNKARAYLSDGASSGTGLKKNAPCASINIGTVGDVDNDPAREGVMMKNVSTGGAAPCPK
ncbi:MAG: hypothetical protein H7840_13220 [Alphaproteobacteria bacterium]